MRISNDPNEPSIHNNGSYVTNFHSFTVKADGVQVETMDILYADTAKNEIGYYVRDEDGYVEVKDKKPVIEVRADKQVSITGTIGDCEPCDNVVQKERKSQPYWNM